MEPAACHFNTYLSTTKIPGYSRVLARRMADRFAVFRDFHCKFIHQIVKVLFSVKFFPCCGFPNILTNMVAESKVNSSILLFCRDPDSSPRLKAWPLSIRLFCSKRVRICRNFNFMECFAVIILTKWHQQIRYGEKKRN